MESIWVQGFIVTLHIWFQWNLSSKVGAIQVPKVRGKCETVLVLYHMDRGGTAEGLKARAMFTDIDQSILNQILRLAHE